MRAWRTHEYGPPLEALRLDMVDVPEPDAGEVRVRVQAIPLNLNDLERITGGNMMVRARAALQPGHGGHGRGRRLWRRAPSAWLGRRVVATTKGAHGGYAEYAVCPAVVDVRHARVHPAARRRRALLPVPSRVARAVRSRRPAARRDRARSTPAPAAPAAPPIQLAAHRGRTGVRHRRAPTRRSRCAESSAPTWRSTTATTDFAEVVLAETGNRGVDVVFDNVGEAVFEPSMKCTAYNGRYLMMGFASNKRGGRRAVRRAPPGRARQHQALRRAARLRHRRDRSAREDGHGVELRRPATRRAGSCGRSSTSSRQDKVHAVVGEVVGFDDIPAAITAMAERRTTGRTIVLVDPKTTG